MIKIFEPRYHDRKVLLVTYKLPCGRDVEIEILRGAYRGIYKVTNVVICKAITELMQTKKGKTIQVKAVKLDDLERIE